MGYSTKYASRSFVRRRAIKKFIPERRDSVVKMFIWMDWVNSSETINILHKMNNGSEIRIGPYLMDGVDIDNKTAYEFNGCYWHGHKCELTSHITDEDALYLQEERFRKTEIKKEFILSEGYKLDVYMGM